MGTLKCPHCKREFEGEVTHIIEWDNDMEIWEARCQHCLRVFYFTMVGDDNEGESA